MFSVFLRHDATCELLHLQAAAVRSILPHQHGRDYGSIRLRNGPRRFPNRRRLPMPLNPTRGVPQAI